MLFFTIVWYTNTSQSERPTYSSLESKPPTLRLHRNRRVDPGETLPMPPNAEADPAWLHKPETQKTEERDCIVISRTLHQLTGRHAHRYFGVRSEERRVGKE